MRNLRAVTGAAIAGLSAGALLVTSALALDLGKLREADDDMKGVAYEGRSVDDLEDMDVLNEAGQRIGEVDDVLIDDDNKVVAVVLDLKDSKRDVVVKMDDLKLADARAKHFTTGLSMQDLMDLPEWRD